MSNPAILFLLGEPNPSGLTVEKIMAMSPLELEDKHDWVQWAFPTWEPSRYNLSAPVLTRAELTIYLPVKDMRLNIARMAEHYLDALSRTVAWRHPGDHNHMRLCRLIKCLRMFKMTELAERVYAFAIRGTSYTDETRCHWFDALNDRIPE